MAPRPTALVYDPDLGSVGGGTQFVSTAAATALASRYDVTLAGPQGVPPARLSGDYGIELGNFASTAIPAEPAAFAARAARFDLLFLTHATWLPPSARWNILSCHFPIHPRWRTWGRWTLPLTRPTFFAHRFDRILCVSAFSGEWIKRRWRVSATVAYPYAVQPPGSIEGKKPIVLSVSRFQPVKRQLEVVRAFRSLCERGITGWELVLAGFSHDAGYLAEIRRESEGLPVRIVTDPDASMKFDLLRQASLFWHIRGLSETRLPDDLEHFGIVLVEAMRAGAVPFAFANGGPPEIIARPGKEGVLVRSAGELVDATFQIISDPSRLRDMARGALERSKVFCKDAFDRVVLDAADTRSAGD